MALTLTSFQVVNPPSQSISPSQINATRPSNQTQATIQPKSRFLRTWNVALSCWQGARRNFELGEPTCPLPDTMMLSLLHLLLFLIAAIFAIKFPTVRVKRIVIAVNTLLASVLGIIFMIDVATRKSNSHLTIICFGY
jgi:hypothetical protein